MKIRSVVPRNMPAPARQEPTGYLDNCPKCGTGPVAVFGERLEAHPTPSTITRSRKTFCFGR